MQLKLVILLRRLFIRQLADHPLVDFYYNKDSRRENLFYPTPLSRDFKKSNCSNDGMS